LFEEKVRKLSAGFKKRFGGMLDYDPEEEIARFKVNTTQEPVVLVFLTMSRFTARN